MSHAIHFVDVFAEQKYAGNQLAVVLDAADLSTETMQQIARETNFSETTFVCANVDHDGDWPVRIFTPGSELPFAGHPTLGTAHVIRRAYLAGAPDAVTLSLGVGAVPVRLRDGHYWLTAPPVTVGERFDASAAAAALGVGADAIDPGFPVQWVDAGPGFVCVPIASSSDLARCSGNLDAYREAFPGRPMLLYCFSRSDAPDADLEVRLFFDAGGVREDPATGSAAACLGAYLLEHGYLGDEAVECTLAQGAHVGRPSRLHLRARDGGGARTIEVGGRVIDVAQGALLE